MKYKVGDEVRVKRTNKETMYKHIEGTTVLILNNVCNDSYQVIDCVGDQWILDEEMLEPAMMRLPIEGHLIYEIYPETLADWFSHQLIEEQALFLSNFLSQLDENRMTELSKEFAQYRYCGKLIANDLDKFAKKAKEILEGKNND